MSARMSLADSLARIRRVALVDAHTPIQPLRRVEEDMGAALNGVTLYVKRDDLMGLGGNNLRKLAYLMGDAAAKGCDNIIATGGIQSNFTRVTAAACARQKVACALVLAPLVPKTYDDYQRNGNTLLNDLFGARAHLLDRGETAADFARRPAEELTAQGRRPYLTPGGGSNSISALGYVWATLEPCVFRQGLRWRDRRCARRSLSSRLIGSVLDDRWNAGAVRLSRRPRAQTRPIMTAELNASYRWSGTEPECPFPQSSITRRLP